MAHKEDGNHHFKLKEYHKAIAAYSEGLKQKFEDADLRVILFTNRAVANFYLGELSFCYLYDFFTHGWHKGRTSGGKNYVKLASNRQDAEPSSNHDDSVCRF